MIELKALLDSACLYQYFSFQIAFHILYPFLMARKIFWLPTLSECSFPLLPNIIKEKFPPLRKLSHPVKNIKGRNFTDLSQSSITDEVKLDLFPVLDNL